MAKRPSLLDEVRGTEVGQGDKTAEVVNITPKTTSTTKAKTVQSTLYLPPKAHRKLKEIAFATDCKMHDLFIQGLDMVLASKGYPPVAELDKK